MTDPGAPFPPPPSKPPTGWSTWSPAAKVFVVLAIVMGSMFGLTLVVTLGTGIWLYVPGSQIASSAAIPANATGFVRVHVDVDDPGVGPTLARLAEQFDAINRDRTRADLPANLRFIADLQRSQSKDVLEMLWPRDVTIAMTGHDPPLAGGILNPRRMGNLLRAVLAAIPRLDKGAQPIDYRGHTILEFDELHYTTSGSSVLFAGAHDVLIGMIDRIEDQHLESAPTELWALSESLRARGDAHAVMLGVPPFLADRGLAEGTVERSGLVFDLLDDDTVTGALVLRPSPGHEAIVVEAARVYLEERARALATEGLVLSVDARPPAREVVFEFRLSGVAAYISRGIQAAMAPRTEDEDLDPAELDEVYRELESFEEDAAELAEDAAELEANAAELAEDAAELAEDAAELEADAALFEDAAEAASPPPAP